MDLTKFPRGARSAKLCSLDMLRSVFFSSQWLCVENMDETRTDGTVPTMNLFKQKRTKVPRACKTFSKIIWILTRLAKHIPRLFEFSQGWRIILRILQGWWPFCAKDEQGELMLQVFCSRRYEIGRSRGTFTKKIWIGNSWMDLEWNLGHPLYHKDPHQGKVEAELILIMIICNRHFYPLYHYRHQGKVEAELILMTGEEAEKNPAGLGRDDPNGWALDLSSNFHQHFHQHHHSSSLTITKSKQGWS